MTGMKAHAMELLRDIPEEKVVHVIEMLKGLRVLYPQSAKPSVPEVTPDSVMGICSKYANPALIHLEKEAWGEAVKEKHGIH